MEREVRKFNASGKDGGYFYMKGDGAMLAYTKILKKGVASCLHMKSYKQLLELIF